MTDLHGLYVHYTHSACNSSLLNNPVTPFSSLLNMSVTPFSSPSVLVVSNILALVEKQFFGFFFGVLWLELFPITYCVSHNLLYAWKCTKNNLFVYKNIHFWLVKSQNNLWKRHLGIPVTHTLVRGILMYVFSKKDFFRNTLVFGIIELEFI